MNEAHSIGIWAVNTANAIIAKLCLLGTYLHCLGRVRHAICGALTVLGRSGTRTDGHANDSIALIPAQWFFTSYDM